MVLADGAKEAVRIQAKARAKAQEQTRAKAKQKVLVAVVMWLYGHNMTIKENWSIFICIYSQEIIKTYPQNLDKTRKHMGGRSERLQSKKDKPPFVDTKRVGKRHPKRCIINKKKKCVYIQK